MSPLDSAESGMGTFISGGNDKKEMKVLQKVQGVANKMSHAEMNLQQRYKDLDEYAARLGTTRETKVCVCVFDYVWGLRVLFFFHVCFCCLICALIFWARFCYGCVWGEYERHGEECDR